MTREMDSPTPFEILKKKLEDQSENQYMKKAELQRLQDDLSKTDEPEFLRKTNLELTEKKQEIQKAAKQIKTDFNRVSKHLTSQKDKIKTQLNKLNKKVIKSTPDEMDIDGLENSTREITNQIQHLTKEHETNLILKDNLLKTINEITTETNFKSNRLGIQTVTPLVIKHWQASSGIIYLFICLIGIGSSWIHYKKIGIKYFDYATIPDFFLAGMNYFITFSLVALFLVLCFYVVNKNRKSYFAQLYSKTLLTKRYVIALFLLASLASLVLSFFTEVIDTNSPAYSVYNSFPIEDLHNVQLIGTTTGFVFFLPRDASNAPAIIIPKSKILAMAADKDHLVASNAITKGTPYQQISQSISNLKSIKAEFDPTVQVTVVKETQQFPQQDIHQLIQKYIERTINTEVHRKNGYSEVGILTVSEPICFRPKLAECEERYIRRIKDFLRENLPIKKLYIVGLSSPEGSDSYNKNLSQNRANHIQKQVKSLCSEKGITIDTETIAIGEAHTLNGISDSRSVYLAYETLPSNTQTPMAMMGTGELSK